ncbi:MAG: Gfo/Idh/MocA family oxidoreductase [Pirellulales bacterium]
MSTLHRRTWIRSVIGGFAGLSAASYLRAAGAKERLRAAVIGRTGRGNYGHSLDRVLQRVPELQLVAVADDDPQGLSEAATRLKVDKAYADYREMLDKEKPHVVSIAPRWIDKHFEMAMACADRGIHMFMEKPFVGTLAEADRLVANCERTNTKLALACQTHYSPKTAMAKQLIAEGKIGRVLEYRARGKEDHRGGAEELWVLGTHVLDLIRFFAGHPNWCFATLTEQGKPVTKGDLREGNEGLGPLAGDQVQANYGMPEGASAFFASRRNSGDHNGGRFGVQIFGSEGVIEIMADYMANVSFLPDPTWSPARSGKGWLNVSSAGIGQPEPIRKVGNFEGSRVAVLDLLAAVRDNRQPLCGMHEARGTLEMIHAVFESHRLQKPVPMPLVNRQHALTLL